MAPTRRSTRPKGTPPGEPDQAGQGEPDAPGSTGAEQAAPAPKRRRAPRQAAAPPDTAQDATPEPQAAPAPPRRRVLVTGGAGFVGRAVVQRLLDRGDLVVAAVRDPERAAFLADAGAELLRDDLSDVRRLADAMQETDGVIHAAGSYRVGITKDQRGAMWDANVGTTTRVLDAAELARVPRIVHVSTVGVFGNTRGRVVDETYRRDLAEGFLSWYDETKYGAHEVAQQRQAAGAPVVIVQPSQVYGPGDRSAVGEQLRLASRGELRYRALDEVGLGWVHVDDLAAGIVAALDRGTPGESYVLTGPRATLREVIAAAAAVRGHRPPRLRVPTRLLRMSVPFGRLVGQPNLGEVIDAGAGVTYWATNEKAVRELGFAPRSIEDGFRDAFGGGSLHSP